LPLVPVSVSFPEVPVMVAMTRFPPLLEKQA
jgi:hypothetical protein